MRISNCGHDENGNYKNGAAGDQSGTEWYVKDSARDSWECFYRANYPEARSKIAEYASAAAANDCIGYDQNERMTFWQHLVTSNYNPAEITINCEADCSSGVGSIVKAVGNVLGISELANVDASLTTYTEDAELTSHGFARISCASDEPTIAGDIMLRNGHTAIVVEGDGENYSGGNETSYYSYVGKTATVCVDCLNVREGAGIAYNAKAKDALTEDGQRHSNEAGQLMNGTRVTVLEVSYNSDDGLYWARIPSGWVCVYNGKPYLNI